MSEIPSKGFDRRAMAGLSAGHLFTDLNQGAVAALLPFLIADRGISLAAAGAILFAATVSSSIVQPLFGIFSDRRPLPALMPLGVLLAGCGMAIVGLATSYTLILLCVVLSGVGVAAFHPEAARFANYVSGSGRARGMSFFSVGGNAGREPDASGQVLLSHYDGYPESPHRSRPNQHEQRHAEEGTGEREAED